MHDLQNCPLTWGNRAPPPNTRFLGPRHRERHSIGSAVLVLINTGRTHDQQTDRQTAEPRYKVNNKQLLVLRTAMAMRTSKRVSFAVSIRLSLTHTHTHTFNGPFSRTTRVSRYQKGQTNLDLLKQETVSGSGISWAICKSAPRSRQIATPAPHHSVFTGRMPFLPPNQQRQSTEGNVTHRLINKAISTCSFVHQQRSTHASCCRQPFACIFLQRARQRTVSCAALRFAVNAA